MPFRCVSVKLSALECNPLSEDGLGTGGVGVRSP